MHTSAVVQGCFGLAEDHGGAEGDGGTPHKQSTRPRFLDRVPHVKVAATYSPTWWGSTIGDGELNFSVRNGKRWTLTAITATVCF